MRWQLPGGVVGYQTDTAGWEKGFSGAEGKATMVGVIILVVS